MTDEQSAFDIEGMIYEAAVAAAPEWRGVLPYQDPVGSRRPSRIFRADLRSQFLAERLGLLVKHEGDVTHRV